MAVQEPLTSGVGQLKVQVQLGIAGEERVQPLEEQIVEPEDVVGIGVVAEVGIGAEAEARIVVVDGIVELGEGFVDGEQGRAVVEGLVGTGAVEGQALD